MTRLVLVEPDSRAAPRCREWDRTSTRWGLYRVYVIELEDFRSRHDPRFPWVYVGQTAKTPEQRLDEHKRGVNAARVVRKHGLRLRPDLYEREPLTTTREEAERLERRVARKLRARGYSVRSNGELPALGLDVGRCPACGHPVLVGNRFYSCRTATSTGCGFRIPTSKAGRTLPLWAVRDLVRQGRTEAPIDRLKGGRGFLSAHLFLKQDSDGTWRLQIERRSVSDPEADS